MRPFISDSHDADTPYESRWEPFWLKEARRVTGGGSDTRALNRLRPTVAALSELYTKDRDAVSREIYRDPALRAAYGLFFFPRTYARVQLVLQELEQRLGWQPPGQGALRLLDLGCGPGSATLAVADQWPDRRVEALAIDQNRQHLQLLQEMTKANPDRKLRLETRAGDLKKTKDFFRPTNDWHLITVGFALGEAFRGTDLERVLEWVRQALASLHPQGLLVLVDPALRETSERLEQIRDVVAASGEARVWAPCPHASQCPLLAAGQYWCHEVRKWQAPASAEYLNRGLNRQIQLLKYSFLVLGHPAESSLGSEKSPTEGRLVSPVAKVSGRLVFSLCANDGAVHTIDAQTRDLDPKEKRRLLKVERGDWMRFENLVALPSGQHYRIGPETEWVTA